MKVFCVIALLISMFFVIGCEAKSENSNSAASNIELIRQDDDIDKLIAAILEKDISEVKKIISGKPNLNVRDSDNMSPLGAAVSEDLEIAKVLLQAGADPDYETLEVGCAEAERCLKKPIEKAIRRNNWEAVELLIDHGVNANDGSALAAAVSRDDAKAVKMLLGKNVDMDFNQDFGLPGSTPFALAESVEVAKLLADAGADIYKKDDEGKTPLDRFTEAGNTELVKFVKTYKPRK